MQLKTSIGYACDCPPYSSNLQNNALLEGWYCRSTAIVKYPGVEVSRATCYFVLQVTNRYCRADTLQYRSPECDYWQRQG